MLGQDFDARAGTWDDDPRKVQRAQWGAAGIKSVVELRADLRVLEYGAGTGLLAQELADSVGALTLADPSAGMRAVMAEKVAAGVLGEAKIIDLDLSCTTAGVGSFDLIVTMMALHHIPDLDGVLAGFAAVLEPGGTLAIIDLDAEDGSFHGPDFSGHEGFEREELSAALVAAGFGIASYTDLPHWEKRGRPYGLFLACCRRL